MELKNGDKRTSYQIVARKDAPDRVVMSASVEGPFSRNLAAPGECRLVPYANGPEHLDGNLVPGDTQ
jgi:hypothetical protein